MKHCTRVLGLVAILLSVHVGLSLPTMAQRGPQTPGTPVSPDYRGLTTARTYQPQPRTTTVAAPDGSTKEEVTQFPAVSVIPISEELRSTYRIDPFYKKSLSVGPLVIIGSEKVSDWAMLEAAYSFDHMLYTSPQWVHDALKTNRVRHAILAVVEYTMDMPENNRGGRNSSPADGAYQDRRSRGLGGLPQSSSGEENLLNLRGDPYGGTGAQGSGENITIHEFSHTLASAIRRNRPEWYQRLRASYEKAMAEGGFLQAYNQARGGRVYASENEQEYWAEGAQAWFDNANPRNSGGLSVRQDVKNKDPGLAALLTEIYGDTPWRYLKTTARKPDGTPLRPKDELEHLVGLDELRPQIPAFNINNSPRVIAAAAQSAGARGARGGDAAPANRGRTNAAPTGRSGAPGATVPAGNTPAPTPARGD